MIPVDPWFENCALFHIINCDWLLPAYFLNNKMALLVYHRISEFVNIQEKN